MSQTLCIKCGSELKVSSYCQLCQEPLIFACASCDYITEEKVHTDCRNAKVLAKTAGAEEVGVGEQTADIAPTTTNTTTTAAEASIPASNNRNQEESTTIVDKHKKQEETVKAEPHSIPSSNYMTTEQDDNNKNVNNVNPFVAASTEIWQSSMTYWLNAYGEFLKSVSKMTENWYNTFWKPWLNWTSQQQQREKWNKL